MGVEVQRHGHAGVVETFAYYLPVAPLSSIKVAWVCLASWSRIPGKPACLTRRLHACDTEWGSNGRPSTWQNTRSFSVTGWSIRSLAALWLSRCCRSIIDVEGDSGTCLRLLGVLGGWKTKLLSSRWWRLRLMDITPKSKSRSDHRRARSSDRRIPVKRAV